MIINVWMVVNVRGVVTQDYANKAETLKRVVAIVLRNNQNLLIKKHCKLSSLRIQTFATKRKV